MHTRRTAIASITVLLLVLGVAQARTALDLERATDLAVEASAAVASARLDLASTERDLARTEADPTTLRVARLQAVHAVERGRTAVRNAEAVARDGAAGAYTAALEADDTLERAEAARAIAAIAREAAGIQFEAGAATRRDVERADDDLRAAERDVEDAAAARALAFDRLASLLGLEVADLLLAAAPEPAPLLPLETYLAALVDNGQLQAARQQVELAEAQLAAIDNPLSTAPADIAAARDRLDGLRLQLAEQERSLTLVVRQAFNAAQSAEARVRTAETTAAAAEEEAEVQRLRFDAGSISALALARADQQRVGQAHALTSARHALHAALRQLQLTLLGAR